MHIVLIRHCTRIDKSKPGISPGQSEISLSAKNGLHLNGGVNINNTINNNTTTTTTPTQPPVNDDEDMNDSSNWLSNFDPPLNEKMAANEMTNAFKKISNDVLNNHKASNIMIHSSPYNRCIQTSELLLDKIKNNKQTDSKIKTKLRVDQALSEWLNENYSLKYLPPNDDGYSMINNVNAYLNQPNSSHNDSDHVFNEKTKDQLRNVKDSTWSYNQLGHCGDYGESASEFTRRCFKYLINLLQYYYRKQTSEADRDMVVFIISHGAVISTLLQILLGRPVFNEIPLCTPIYFKQSSKRRSVFKLMDYDFNLNKLLATSTDQEFYKILDSPIDLTKLDADNLRSELTIGTTGHTTIIQSIPKPMESPKVGVVSTFGSSSTTKSRKRRNTINIGDKEKDTPEDNNIESLKHTRSSNKLYLLNKDTSDEKVIDLEKLHSYFSGGDSGSSSDSEDYVDDNKHYDKDEDYEYDGGASLKKNVFKGSITSLSSFNEENKSKFQLNMTNFFSKPSPIKSDPFSHFFLHKNSALDDDFVDEFNMSRKNSVFTEVKDETDKPSAKKIIVDQSEDSDESDEGNSDDDGPMLTFGTRNQIHKLFVDEDKDDSGSVEIGKNKSTVFDGTFSKVPIVTSSSSKLNLTKMHSYGNHNNSNSQMTSNSSGNHGDDSKNNKSASEINVNMKRNSSSKIQLISTRNVSLHVRGGEEGEDFIDKYEKSYGLADKSHSKSNQSGVGLGIGFGMHALDVVASDSEEESDDDGWFGGFSR